MVLSLKPIKSNHLFFHCNKFFLQFCSSIFIIFFQFYANFYQIQIENFSIFFKFFKKNDVNNKNTQESEFKQINRFFNKFSFKDILLNDLDHNQKKKKLRKTILEQSRIRSTYCHYDKKFLHHLMMEIQVDRQTALFGLITQFIPAKYFINILTLRLNH